ncbi:MAG: hypothetical protein HYZ38_13775 [Mycobacterium sp.]|nr:hypothetical protein [Mycobacterium sp.]
MSDVERSDDADGPVISRYGIGSVVLALVGVAAAVVIGLTWSGHRADVADRTRQTDAMQAAADWTGVLINMNTDNVDASLQKLHDGTVGELNADFESSVQPYREVVQTLKAKTTGRIESVAIEKIHHDLDRTPGASAPEDASMPPGMGGPTDTVLVIATSVSQNAGAAPQTVRWNLRLDVTEVDGKMLISHLESMR